LILILKHSLCSAPLGVNQQSKYLIYRPTSLNDHEYSYYTSRNLKILLLLSFV